MNLRENYKRLFKGRIGSNDSKLISEAMVKVDSGEVNGMDRTASGTYSSFATGVILKKWKLETDDGFTSIFVNGKSIDDDDPMYDDILTTVNDEGYELED